MEFKEIAQAVMDFGMTTLLAILVIFLLIAIVSKLPKLVQKYAEEYRKERKAESEKYDKYIETMAKALTQSNELQKASTDVIAKNTDVINSCIETNKIMLNKMEILHEQSARTERAAIDNRAVVNKVNDTVLKIDERTRKNG